MGEAPDYQNEQTLRKLYWDDEMTVHELADHFDISTATVHYWMEKHDIDRRFSGTLKERFEQYHEKDGEDECWEWQNEPNEWGYGTIWGADQERHRMAHRVAYEFEHGEIPDGKIICHTCHNPACVNPNHLYAGTHQENADDRHEADRWEENKPVGERVGTSKLTESQVVEIKRRLEKGDEYQYEIAEDYDVSHSMINKIAVGEWWSHVDV